MEKIKIINIITLKISWCFANNKITTLNHHFHNRYLNYHHQHFPLCLPCPRPPINAVSITECDRLVWWPIWDEMNHFFQLNSNLFPQSDNHECMVMMVILRIRWWWQWWWWLELKRRYYSSFLAMSWMLPSCGR